MAKRSRRATFSQTTGVVCEKFDPDTADARIDAHRPATDRLGPEWRIPLYEL